jgi:hypothetical protein
LMGLQTWKLCTLSLPEARSATIPTNYLQVLNMKPAEVLGMLEEAAGTRMYENKKEAALRTLEKKQVKVDEINKVGCCRQPPHVSSRLTVPAEVARQGAGVCCCTLATPPMCTVLAA